MENDELGNAGPSNDAVSFHQHYRTFAYKTGGEGFVASSLPLDTLHDLKSSAPGWNQVGSDSIRFSYSPQRNSFVTVGLKQADSSDSPVRVCDFQHFYEYRLDEEGRKIPLADCNPLLYLSAAVSLGSYEHVYRSSSFPENEQTPEQLKQETFPPLEENLEAIMQGLSLDSAASLAVLLRALLGTIIRDEPGFAICCPKSGSAEPTKFAAQAMAVIHSLMPHDLRKRLSYICSATNVSLSQYFFCFTAQGDGLDSSASLNWGKITAKEPFSPEYWIDMVAKKMADAYTGDHKNPELYEKAQALFGKLLNQLGRTKNYSLVSQIAVSLLSLFDFDEPDKLENPEKLFEELSSSLYDFRTEKIPIPEEFEQGYMKIIERFWESHRVDKLTFFRKHLKYNKPKSEFAKNSFHVMYTALSRDPNTRSQANEILKAEEEWLKYAKEHALTRDAPPVDTARTISELFAMYESKEYLDDVDAYFSRLRELYAESDPKEMKPAYDFAVKLKKKSEFCSFVWKTFEGRSFRDMPQFMAEFDQLRLCSGIVETHKDAIWAKALQVCEEIEYKPLSKLAKILQFEDKLQLLYRENFEKALAAALDDQALVECKEKYEDIANDATLEFPTTEWIKALENKYPDKQSKISSGIPDAIRMLLPDLKNEGAGWFENVHPAMTFIELYDWLSGYLSEENREACTTAFVGYVVRETTLENAARWGHMDQWRKSDIRIREQIAEALENAQEIKPFGIDSLLQILLLWPDAAVWAEGFLQEPPHGEKPVESGENDGAGEGDADETKGECKAPNANAELLEDQLYAVFQFLQEAKLCSSVELPSDESIPVSGAYAALWTLCHACNEQRTPEKSKEIARRLNKIQATETELSIRVYLLELISEKSHGSTNNELAERIKDILSEYYKDPHEKTLSDPTARFQATTPPLNNCSAPQRVAAPPDPAHSKKETSKAPCQKSLAETSPPVISPANAPTGGAENVVEACEITPKANHPSSEHRRDNALDSQFWPKLVQVPENPFYYWCYYNPNVFLLLRWDKKKNQWVRCNKSKTKRYHGSPPHPPIMEEMQTSLGRCFSLKQGNAHLHLFKYDQNSAEWTLIEP